jgi:outer membrane protein with beta-barrel domain
MRHFAIIILITAVAAGINCHAVAGSSTVGMTITSDREPDDFRDPKDTKYELNGGHTFDSGLILGGSFQFSDTAFSNRTSQNLEGTLGYRVPLEGAFSVSGSAGIGEHWRQNPYAAFPYYVLRIGAGVDLSDHVTWDVISYRYRNAFDPNDNYNTPQLATGFTYKLDADTSVSAKIMRNWKDGDPSSTGVSLGFKRKF